MERIESEELKNYLINFAESKLDACRLFTDVYGIGFAKKQLSINLDKVYIQKYDWKNRGNYRPKEASITISCPQDGDIISVISDIENNVDDCKCTILHESIHAILVKNRIECLRRKIKFGTGIYERYDNNTELGRGLNEGLTNWICKKAGLTPVSYKNIMEIVDLLEFAIGEECVMKLGKGNIKGNVSRQLNMTQEETYRLLSLIDDINYREEKRVEIDNIYGNIEQIRMLKEDSKTTPRDRLDLQEKIQSLKENSLFIKATTSEEYKNFLLAQGKEHSVDAVKDFFGNTLKRAKARCNLQTNMVKEVIFNKYFKKEAEEMMKMQDLSPQQRLRLDKMYELFQLYDTEYSATGMYEYDTTGMECPEIENFISRYEGLKGHTNNKESTIDRKLYPTVPKTNIFSRISLAIRKMLRNNLEDTVCYNEKVISTSRTKHDDFKNRVTNYNYQEIAQLKNKKTDRNTLQEKDEIERD